MRQSLLLFFILFVSGSGAPSSQLQTAADPDHFGFGLSWNGTEQIRLGQSFPFGPLTVGGLVEIRNEPRFNQGLFPNHNWKGYFSAKLTKKWSRKTNLVNALHLGVEHESAHPTMGIMEPTEHPFELVYDGLWRTVNLNALRAAFSRHHRIGQFEGFSEMRGLWFFSSRNQPELYNNGLGTSVGFALGVTPLYHLDSLQGLYGSLFFRAIRESGDRFNGLVWVTTPSGETAQEHRDYPAITGTHTLVTRFGYLRRLKSLPYSLDIYALFLQGNPGGFVDSRDERKEFRVGFEFR